MEILAAWAKSGEYVDRLLHEALRLSRLDRRDRAFVTELVCGVFRNRGRLDWELAGLCSGDFLSLPDAVKDALRLGLYQIRFLDRIPVHAAVGESVEAVKRTPVRGMAGLVNGVLRNAVRRPGPRLGEDAGDGELSRFYSLPPWLFGELSRQIGREPCVAFAQASLAPPPLYVRVNGSRASVAAAIESLRGDGAEVHEVDGVPGSLMVVSDGLPDELDAHRAGLIQIQDASSTLIGLLCSPRAGEAVIDACCAPGGKLAHLADLAGPDARVSGFDRSELRLEMTAENLRRLGFDGVRLECRDLETDDAPWSESPSLLLLDVPCSGTGTFRRRVDLKWRLSSDTVDQAVGVQRRLLENGARRVASGGRVVYSTCSVLARENEAVVMDFLSRHPDFALRDAGEILPEACRRFVDGNGFLRTWPHRDGLDGVFAAVLVRRGSASGDGARDMKGECGA